MQASLLYLGYGLIGMVVGMVVANLLLLPPMAWRLGVRPRWPSRATLASLWSFARSSIPESFVGTALSRMDRLLLGAIATTAAVGNYEIAMNVTMPAMFVAGVASNRLLGRVSERASQDAAIDREVRNVIATVSVVAVPIFFGALVIGDVLVITIYSDAYTQAGTFVAGLAFYRLLKSQETILRSTIDGLNRPDLNVRISTAVFAVNLVLGVGLLLEFGPIGIIVATLVGELLAYGLRAAVLSRLTAVELLPRPLFAQVLAGGFMAMVVWGARQALGVPSWPFVAVYVGLGAVCYFSFLGILSKEFRDTTLRLIQDVRTSRY
jgi:O-antigen/teichoic acid export membrane protein